MKKAVGWFKHMLMPCAAAIAAAAGCFVPPDDSSADFSGGYAKRTAIAVAANQ